MEIKSEHWEADEYVITLNGRPVGGTHHKRESETITRWLRGAINEIREAIEKEAAKDEDT